MRNVDYFYKKGFVHVLKQAEIILSVKLSGNVNTSEAVITNQVELASPVFEPLDHQRFCEKSFDVWARKGCGRSSVMYPS